MPNVNLTDKYKSIKLLPYKDRYKITNKEYNNEYHMQD